MKSPAPLNPYTQAAAQEGAERTAAFTSNIMNNPNRYNPWGSQTYTVDHYETVTGSDGKQYQIPRYNETTTLSPTEMKKMGLMDDTMINLGTAAKQQSAALGPYLAKGVDYSGVGGWSKGAAPTWTAGAIRQDQGATDRASIERAMMERFNRDQERTGAAQDAQLAARGMTPGSAGYGSVQEGRDRARVDAGNQAYLASGAEARAAQGAYNAAQQQQFGQDLTKYQAGQDYASFVNQLHQAQTAEAIQKYHEPINAITALLSGVQLQNPQYPGFTGQGINAAPIGGYMQNTWNQQSQQANAFNQGIFGLGQAFLGIPGLFGTA